MKGEKEGGGEERARRGEEGRKERQVGQEAMNGRDE